MDWKNLLGSVSASVNDDLYGMGHCKAKTYGVSCAGTICARLHEYCVITASNRTMVMTTISTEDPQFQSAIEACAFALRRMADYELNPTLRQRMHELGERKEYLSPDEHEELLALVDFSQKRTVEKLEAQTALSRLRAALQGVLSES